MNGNKCILSRPAWYNQLLKYFDRIYKILWKFYKSENKMSFILLYRKNARGYFRLFK